MPDDDLHYLKPRSDRPAVGGLRLFQFNLLSVFVTMTVMALILSIYFSVGRLIGMSTMEVVMQGLGQFLFVAPTLLVWIVGLTIAIRQRKRHRVPATLTMIALVGLVLTSFTLQVVQMVLIHSVNSGRISHEILGWSFAILGVLHAVVNTGCWVLILVAIFAHRTPDAPERNNPCDKPPPRTEQDSP